MILAEVVRGRLSLFSSAIEQTRTMSNFSDNADLPRLRPILHEKPVRNGEILVKHRPLNEMRRVLIGLSLLGRQKREAASEREPRLNHIRQIDEA